MEAIDTSLVLLTAVAVIGSEVPLVTRDKLLLTVQPGSPKTLVATGLIFLPPPQLEFSEPKAVAAVDNAD